MESLPGPQAKFGEARFCAEHAVGMREVHRLRAEIERLEDAKRRALQLADERAKEANALRSRLSERPRC